MTWLIPAVLSSLILAVMAYTEPSGPLFLPDPPGTILFGLFGLVSTIVLFMPFYGFATILKTRLKWPEWIRLPIVAGMWFSVWLSFYLANPAGQSGLHSMSDVFVMTLQFWGASLAYGIPSVIARSYATPYFASHLPEKNSEFPPH